MGNVLELMAMLSLNSSDYEKGLKRASGSAKAFGSGFAKVGKAVAVGVAAGAGAIAALSKKSVDAYANYEQLAGGVKKLYQGASKDIMEYANNAYKTSGMSANQYMQTATSFSAALVNSLGGNYSKAAKQTDVAMRAISDNFNTFGGDIGMIEGAFQGFAKGQFMMLDNLKLGYGGTKGEMERLIKDAEEYAKANGKAADLSIDSFSDIVTAIELIQEKQHIAGTTAKEASTTIEGSVMATKAAWENLLVGFADSKQDIGELASVFVETLSTAANNVIPRFVQAFKGMASFIPAIFESAMVKVGEYIQKVPAMLGKLATMSYELPSLGSGDFLSGLFDGIVSGIESVLPAIQAYGPVIVANIVSAISNAAGAFTDAAVPILESIASGLESGIPTLMSKALPVLLSLSDGLRANAGKMVDAGLSLILSLAKGLANALPTLITYVPAIVTNIAGVINDNAPKILEAGFQLIVILGQGLINAIPTIVANIPQIITAIVAVFMAFNWASLGKSVIKGIGNGLKSAGSFIKSTMKRAGKAAWNGFKAEFKASVKGGANIMKALGNALKNGAQAAVKAVARQFGKIKDKMLKPFKEAADKVKEIIDKIKGWFPFKIGNLFSGFKVPSISLSTASKTLLGKSFTYPTGFNVTWHKKAMENPYVFNGATIFGAGEAGDEILYGRQKLMDDIAEATSASGQSVEITNYITVDGAEDPEEFADRFARQLKMDMRTT